MPQCLIPAEAVSPMLRHARAIMGLKKALQAYQNANPLHNDAEFALHDAGELALNEYADALASIGGPR